MKIVYEKLALAANVFLPVIILVFVVGSYFATSDERTVDNPGETEQVITKKQTPLFQTRGKQQLHINADAR
jgi:hypothetical protein